MTFFLTVHITGALVALVVAVLLIQSAISRNARISMYSRVFSGIFIVDIYSGILLTVSSGTSVVSVCDNLALYAALFTLVQGFALWRMWFGEWKISSAPLFTGLSIPAVFTALALLAGF